MKRMLKIAAIALAALLLVVLSVPFWFDANYFRPMLESSLSKALGRSVKLGDLKLAILSGSVTANDLAIGDDPAFSKAPFVAAKSFKLQVDLWPLILSRQLHVKGLVIDGPEITLLQSPSGRWNFSSLGAASAAPQPAQPAQPAPEKTNLDLSVSLVRITNGRFTLGKTGVQSKPLVLDPVALEVRDFSASSPFPFSFSTKVASGGEVHLDGKAGPMDAADAAMTPAQFSLKVAQFDLGRSGVLGNAPIAALISFDGSAESKAGVVSANGKLTAEKLKLAPQGTPAPNPVALDFAVEHNLGKQSGAVRRGDIHIGKALASLTGTYTQRGESTVLKMAFAAHNMPVPELAAMLPALGIALPMGTSLQGGSATAEFTIDGPAEALVTAGSIDFDKTRLAGFDLPKKMSGIERLAGMKNAPDMEIDTLSAKVRMAPEGISAQEIKLVVPAMGEMGGGGTISSALAMDFKMTASVHSGGVMTIVNNQPIPFTVTGTCAEPVFRPDVKAVAKEEVKSVGKAAGGLVKGLLGGGKHQ